MNIDTEGDWNRVNTDVFWSEIAPCDHVVQVYENQQVFLDALAGFVGGGINAGECVIIIASDSNLNALQDKLVGFGISVDTLIKDERYIALSAEETLSKFMINGWPDETLFMNTISELINKGVFRNRKVRAFGEMVAILWEQGNAGATIHLEYLWNKFCEKHAFSLFCAYPKSGFTTNNNESISNICSCHSKIIDGAEQSLTQILYKNSK